MRDPKRIYKFCNELAKYWHKVPDWRFGQFISNVLGDFQAKHGDIFFPEDDKFLEFFEEYFKESD